MKVLFELFYFFNPIRTKGYACSQNTKGAHYAPLMKFNKKLKNDAKWAQMGIDIIYLGKYIQ